jgi:hypothetical protein
MSSEKLENRIYQNYKFEVIKTPEIIVREEKGAQLLSLLLKAENSEWGETETSLAKETSEYFKESMVDSSILEVLKELHAEGVDEETFYNIALTYQHPERIKDVFEFVVKNKPDIKNPEEVHQRLLAVLEMFDKLFSSSSLAKKFTKYAELDKDKRLKILKITKKRIENLINFFKPDQTTTRVRKISLMPTDPLYKKDSGYAFAFDEELVLKNHIENPDNLDHEFLHTVINPIVEKLSLRLTDDQKRKSSQLASAELRQDYGEEYFSLLCEELIRTYCDVFRKGEKLLRYEDFLQKVYDIKEDKFIELITQSEGFKERCEELDIKTVEDFKKKSREYFERFYKNQLRDLCFELYEEYNREKERGINFESFLLERFKNKLL